MIHVGELQHILSMIRPENAKLVDDGNKEAGENADDNLEPDSIEESYGEEERKEVIDRNWIRINQLDSYRPAGNVKDEFEINIITKQVRNSKTGHIIPYVDQIGTTAMGEKTVAVRKEDGKNTNLQKSRLARAVTRQYPTWK